MEPTLPMYLLQIFQGDLSVVYSFIFLRKIISNLASGADIYILRAKEDMLFVAKWTVPFLPLLPHFVNFFC